MREGTQSRQTALRLKGSTVHVSIIAAVAENGIIGANGTLPWRLSSDLRTFRRLTMGKPVIMGRKTFLSLNKPLDGRDNIVITQDPNFAPDGVSVVTSFQDSLTLSRTLALTAGAEEIMIIGGANVFKAAWPFATRLYWTTVHATPEGDTSFPDHDLTGWSQVSEEPLPQGPNDDFKATLKILERDQEVAS